MNVSLIELMVRRGSHCPRGTNSSADNVLHMLARNWYQGNMADIVFGLVNMVGCLATRYCDFVTVTS